MNNYLTAKVTVNSAANVIKLIVFGILFTAGVSVMPSQFKDSTLQGVVAVILTILLALPIVKVIFIYYYMSLAKKYAYVFANNTDTTITFSELRDHLNRSNVEDELQKLITKKYIKNVIVEMNTQTVVLTSENAMQANKIYVEVTCPGCGNAITIVKGEAAKCPYCDRALLG